MFKKGKPVHDGASAQAIVTAAMREGGFVGGGGVSAIQYRLELRVSFDDGSTADTECTVGGMIRGTDLVFAEGDIVPVRYDATDRSKIEVDVAAMETGTAARSEAFQSAAVVRSEMQLSAQAAAQNESHPPTDEELQDAYNRWGDAMDKASAHMEDYKQAKAAGDTAAAGRLLKEGAIHNAEQEALGAECKRLRALRPEWRPKARST